jgi:gliding motility-associated-like protein
MISRKFIGALLFICLFQVLKANPFTISTSKDTVCTGANIKFSNSVPNGLITQFKWITDSTNGVTILPNDSSKNVTINFANAGTYTVTLYVTFNHLTIDSAKKTITVIQSATASFTSNSISIGVPQNVTFTNTSINAPNGYAWNFSDNGTSFQTNPTHIFTNAATYEITLIAYGAKGCNDTITNPLAIIDTAGLTMPNVFTPNGDGVNDYYAPNAHSLKTMDCTIYDRWGAKIIDLDMNLQFWDGYTTSGIACTAGTYYYVIKATDINGKSYNLKGYIQLIK